MIDKQNYRSKIIRIESNLVESELKNLILITKINLNPVLFVMKLVQYRDNSIWYYLNYIFVDQTAPEVETQPPS